MDVIKTVRQEKLSQPKLSWAVALQPLSCMTFNKNYTDRISLWMVVIKITRCCAFWG